MSIDTESHIYNKPTLEIKSTSFNVPVLVFSGTEQEQISVLLKEKISQAPDFFENTPVLIDLEEINRQGQVIDLPLLIESLYKMMLFPIGISGGTDQQNNLALELNIPVHTLRKTKPYVGRSSQQIPEKNSKIIPNEATLLESASNKIGNTFISLPVRSGQRIYSKGDLTILSHVSAGAEVMAEGNIHVYGSLRGRALAGVLGNVKSCIFCSELKAELISIAGVYKISEELDAAENNKPVHIFLRDNALIINNL